MKVVINASPGGFSLSTAALKRAINEGAVGVVSYTEKEWGIVGGDLIVSDAGDGLLRWGFDDVLYQQGHIYTFRNREYSVLGHIIRNDPILVNIIEGMGERANGKYASLKVVEIPDDVDWEIIERGDGSEYVTEVCRTWA